MVQLYATPVHPPEIKTTNQLREWVQQHAPFVKEMDKADKAVYQRAHRQLKARDSYNRRMNDLETGEAARAKHAKTVNKHRPVKGTVQYTWMRESNTALKRKTREGKKEDTTHVSQRQQGVPVAAITSGELPDAKGRLKQKRKQAPAQKSLPSHNLSPTLNSTSTVALQKTSRSKHRQLPTLASSIDGKHTGGAAAQAQAPAKLTSCTCDQFALPEDISSSMKREEEDFLETFNRTERGLDPYCLKTERLRKRPPQALHVGYRKF